MAATGPADGGHRTDDGRRAAGESRAGRDRPGPAGLPDRSLPARTEQARADHARAARTALADFLRESVGIDIAVESAFRQVPRHLFVPELQPQLVYQDESVVVKVGEDGTPVSSSSQPTMMAIMLDQLGLERGHRVLEIGAGTGYNAALMAHIVGEDGSVVTVDIDAELTARASASLAAAGYGQVRVACADGGLGFASGAPYDRIILTVGAWDIAPQWQEQLAPGGRIVLPLSVRGLQLSLALDHADGYLTSRSAVRCGFIRLAGTLAGPEVLVPAGPQPGVRFETDDGRPLDADAVYAALTGPAVVVVADVPEVSGAELSDADLWLTLAEPELVRVSAFGGSAGSPAAGSPRPFSGLAEAARADGRLGIAAVALGPAETEAEPGGGLAEAGAAEPGGGGAGAGLAEPGGGPTALLVRGYGPSGTELAGYLAARAGTWHRLGRPGVADLRLRVFPAGVPGGSPPDGLDGSMILRRPGATLALDWRR
ncbi:MAG TPA: methyltransferase domain-containing protein [Streptosporangiaceae bacterium]|nr:methyltransferase domain-containing protein [Streptosporangiaceae bacterium]